MKRFRVEHKNFEQPDMIITLFNPPYEDEDVIARCKHWKVKDSIITDITPKFIGEE
jgi:hypothetical protein